MFKYEILFNLAFELFNFRFDNLRKGPPLRINSYFV